MTRLIFKFLKDKFKIKMSINLIFSIVYITSIVSAQFGGKGKGAETDGGVLVLTDKNFLMEGLDRPWFLVEFYAPWW